MPFWSDPYIEPKRSHRFLVACPVFAPSEAQWAAANDRSIYEMVADDAAALEEGVYGKDLYFDFLATTCTLPQYKTNIYRSKAVQDGFQSIMPTTQATYEFENVTVELIDTLDYDIASTLTAYLYAYGGVVLDGAIVGNDMAVDGWNPVTTAKDYIPFSNGAPGRFAITELLDGNNYARPSDPLATKNTHARKWVLYNPRLAAVDFGTRAHAGEEFATVKITLDYDGFDYQYTQARDSGFALGVSDRTLVQNHRRELIRRRSQALDPGGNLGF